VFVEVLYHLLELELNVMIRDVVLQKVNENLMGNNNGRDQQYLMGS
jgi:hypothetical protein